MRKILVIEDEHVVCNNILRILKAEGYEPIGAENGMMGVQIALENKPDLILCDIMMPDLDGYGVLMTLQENPETALIPFIFLTAKVERADIRQGIELGADDYLTKPFDTDELLRAIAARFNKQELFRDRLTSLSEEINKIQIVMEAKDRVFTNLDREFRQPLSNINLAIKMLETDMNYEQRERYLHILRTEFERELSLLNQMSQLQKLLTADNLALLSQFNLLKPN